MGANDEKRILFYSHDAFGLGHLRRATLLATAFLKKHPSSRAAIVTASGEPQSFATPPRAEIVRLPPLLREIYKEEASYRSPTEGLSVSDAVRIRKAILLETVRRFRPHLFVVDFIARGVGGELGPVFEELRDRDAPTKLVFGLRDIDNRSDVVEREWNGDCAWEAFKNLYDRILVYADPKVFTTAHELRLPEILGSKVKFVGYLGRVMRQNNDASSAGGRIHVLVTAGGGGDGAHLLQSYTEALRQLSSDLPLESTVLSGPLMMPKDFRMIAAGLRAAGRPYRFLRLADPIENLYQHAQAVVSMGGYNSVVEALSSGLPALIVPRNNTRGEQRVRAERLAPHTSLNICWPGQSRSRSVVTFIKKVAAGDARAHHDLRLDGLDQTIEELSALIEE